LLAALAVAGLTGCIAIPIPVDHAEGRVVDPQKTPIEIGVTTRDEIIARVGKPDAVFEDERVLKELGVNTDDPDRKISVFVYTWQHANVLWLVAVANFVAGGHYSYSDDVLCIQFDASGRVARAVWAELPDTKSYGMFVSEWVKETTHANP
jgi:hypothetical protein